MLRPKQFYYDCLLVTFDWICTTTCCRTGELAPLITKPGAEAVIPSLSHLKIGGTWFSKIHKSKRHVFLTETLSQAVKGEIPYFQFWLTKTKANSTITKKILITCCAGTQQHPILIYLLNTLILRSTAGDPLDLSSPLFAIAIRKKNQTHFLPLSYSDIASADRVRTEALGNTDLPVRTHLRRKGGASDLYDAGVSLKDIKVCGH